MKKIWAIGFSAAVLLTACGGEDSTKATETTASAESSEEGKKIKQELMKFYMSIPNSINAVDADLNAFETAQADGELPEGEELQAMKDAAIASAEEAAATVENIEIPAVLEDQQGKIQEAFAAMHESYEMKAEELPEDASFGAAEEKFAEADAKLNELLVEQDLAASSIYNEVSQ